MSAPYGHLKRKAEDAMAAVIEANRGNGPLSLPFSFQQPNSDGVTYTNVNIVAPIRKGADGLDLTESKRVHVIAVRAMPWMIPGYPFSSTALWHVQFEVWSIINVHTFPDRIARAEFAGALWDILLQDNMVQMLNDAGIQDFQASDENPKDDQGRGWSIIEPGIESRTNGAEYADVFHGELFCGIAMQEQGQG